MEQPTVYHMVTTFEQALKYSDKTLLFTAGDSKLKLYDALGTTLEVMPHPYRGTYQKIPLIAKFEVNGESEKPQTISAACLTQFGYKEGRVKLALEGSSRTHKMRLRRVSVVPVNEIKTDITEKLEYFEKLRQYKQKVERYTESQTEIVHPSGAIDAEFIDLAYTSYGPLLGGKPKECKDDLMIKKYGLTAEEYNLIDQTRGVITEMGIAFCKGLTKLKDRQIIVPGTEGFGEIGEAMQRFLEMNKLVKEKGVIVTRDGSPVESLEEHTVALSLMAGIHPAQILSMLRNPPRIEDG